MFKLLITLVMVGLSGVILYVVYRLIYNSVKNNINISQPKTQDLDELVEDFTHSLNEMESRSSKNISKSENKIKKEKSNLKKVKQIKSKI